MMKVNHVPIGSSPRVRRSRTARFKRARKRKSRPKAELLMCRGRIPRVPGAGSVQLNLFEQPGGSASRFPKRRLATVVSFAGAVVVAAGFFLLLHPLGFAIGGSLLVFFVLRDF